MARLLTATGLLVIMVGCTPPMGQPTASPPAAEPPTGSPPGHTAAPASPTAPTASPPVNPTQQPIDDDPMPPPAELVLPDGSTVAGALGSYAYDGAAADSPWLPARILPVIELAPGSPVELRLAGPQRFVRWSARFADAADEDADVISPLASGGDGEPLEDATFGGLPAGDWVLMLQLHFADDLGDAAYYWHAVVR